MFSLFFIHDESKNSTQNTLSFNISNGIFWAHKKFLVFQVIFEYSKLVE